MLLVSGPDLVIEACRAGVVGSFPTKNCRTVDELERWLARMQEETDGGAPYAPNLIVHKTNTRLHEDMKLVEKYAPALVITSVGSPAPVMDTIHAAGGLVFADVASMRHVERALQVGVDGLILLTAGAGGQTGWANPLAFVRAVRSVFDGPVVLAGGVADGVALRAAIVLGCDLAYMGTRFIATKQSLAAPGYKDMLVTSSLDDIVLSRALTGLETNLLRPSVELAGNGRYRRSARSMQAPQEFRRMHRNAGRTCGRPATPWRRYTTFPTWPISSIVWRPSTHRQRDKGGARAGGLQSSRFHRRTRRVVRPAVGRSRRAGRAR